MKKVQADASSQTFSSVLSACICMRMHAAACVHPNLSRPSLHTFLLPHARGRCHLLTLCVASAAVGAPGPPPHPSLLCAAATGGASETVCIKVFPFPFFPFIIIAGVGRFPPCPPQLVVPTCTPPRQCEAEGAAASAAAASAAAAAAATAAKN